VQEHHDGRPVIVVNIPVEEVSGGGR